MQITFQRTFLHSSALGLGLLIVFAMAVLGCGSGMMPSMPAMHGESAECSGMFTSTFMISSKELGVVQSLVFFIAACFLLVFWSVLLVRLFISQQYSAQILFWVRNKLLRFYDYILQQFSAGILHPQVY